MMDGLRNPYHFSRAGGGWVGGKGSKEVDGKGKDRD